MKSADLVKIIIYLLSGLATAVYGFVFGTSSRWLLTATLLGLLALRAYQTWASVSYAKHTINEFIRTTLYHRSQDSQRGGPRAESETAPERAGRGGGTPACRLLTPVARGCPRAHGGSAQVNGPRRLDLT